MRQFFVIAGWLETLVESKVIAAKVGQLFLHSRIAGSFVVESRVIAAVVGQCLLLNRRLAGSIVESRVIAVVVGLIFSNNRLAGSIVESRVVVVGGQFFYSRLAGNIVGWKGNCGAVAFFGCWYRYQASSEPVESRVIAAVLDNLLDSRLTENTCGVEGNCCWLPASLPFKKTSKIMAPIQQQLPSTRQCSQLAGYNK